MRASDKVSYPHLNFFTPWTMKVYMASRFSHPSEPPWTQYEVESWRSKLAFPQAASDEAYTNWHWMMAEWQYAPSLIHREIFLQYACENPDLRFALKRLDGPGSCLTVVFDSIWVYVNDSLHKEERICELRKRIARRNEIQAIKSTIENLKTKIKNLQDFASDKQNELYKVYKSVPGQFNAAHYCESEINRFGNISRMLDKSIDEIQRSEHILWRYLLPPANIGTSAKAYLNKEDNFFLYMVFHAVKIMTTDSVAEKSGDYRWTAMATVMNAVAHVLGSEKTYGETNLKDNFRSLTKNTKEYERQWNEIITERRKASPSPDNERMAILGGIPVRLPAIKSPSADTASTMRTVQSGNTDGTSGWGLESSNTLELPAWKRAMAYLIYLPGLVARKIF